MDSSLIYEHSVRSREELEDDTNYFQAVHDDELETIELFTAQTQQISKLLGSRGQAPETAAVPGETAEAYTLLILYYVGN
ncbi:hypothetical protein M405DRAFT_810182 [Rhizopogon salebrosus TDB-379]|nr:hypothetical protein M405DRAFT_810182 [Rhizopogon salebrosus TDB-379]